jgi:uncharacterized protein YeeX (DUF496 family)
MKTSTYGLIGVAAAATVAGAIIYLQSFDAGKIACDKIADARAELEATYEAGVTASVAVFAEERSLAEERLSQCLSAKPADPCAEAQRARDAAVEKYNGIASPPDNAPYPQYQKYFQQREEAYANYKKAKDALDQCRSANPPPVSTSYEQSDTKACFDAYDASMQKTQDVFTRDTQTMRSALTRALAALDEREKACNPPVGNEKFTDPPRTAGTSPNVEAESIMSCRLVNPETDAEILSLRRRAAAIPGEIQDVQKSIENINKRTNSLTRDLAEVDTYIPPESVKTQFEGTLNALRAQRKVAIESALDFYKGMLARKQAESDALQQELKDVEKKIRARLDQIKKENDARQKNFPTALRQSKPDKCAYYHCHGTLCGKPDPAPDGCGHGATTQEDVQCVEFFNAYLNAATTN